MAGNSQNTVVFAFNPEISLRKITSRGALISFGPFPRGTGQEYARIIRSLLLHDLEGFGVIAYRIEGDLNDSESWVIEAALLELALTGTDASSGSGKITVSSGGIEISMPRGISVCSKKSLDQIASVGASKTLSVALLISKGRGIRFSGDNISVKIPKSMKESSVRFSPVMRVGSRVTQDDIDYESIVFDIECDDRMSPLDAMSIAKEKIKGIRVHPRYCGRGSNAPRNEPLPALPQHIYDDIASLELSVRASRCIDVLSLKYVGQLCRLTEDDLMKIKNFGRMSLNEVKDQLASRGLSFGMELPGFAPSQARSAGGR